MNNIDDLDDDNDGILDSIEMIGTTLAYELLDNGMTNGYAPTNVAQSIAAIENGSFIGTAHNVSASIGYWVNGSTIDFQIFEQWNYWFSCSSECR